MKSNKRKINKPRSKLQQISSACTWLVYFEVHKLSSWTIDRNNLGSPEVYLALEEYNRAADKLQTALKERYKQIRDAEFARRAEKKTN